MIFKKQNFNYDSVHVQYIHYHSGDLRSYFLRKN